MTGPVQHSLVGELVDGRYRVLEDIAEGGMATVHLALDERLDREVALKVMRPHLASDEVFVSRFRREARSVARIAHPNVVALYDQGQEGDRIFLVMEYVPGRTLRDLITEEGPLTPRAALDILEPVLDGLATAHRRGIIHRDVKPENVLMHEDGMVKVADFGLARAITSQTASANAGVLFGTVAYLAPEQVERGIADARSDVYATGLLLFEALTGRAGVIGETPIAVAYQHVHGGVPRASSLNEQVPAALDDLIARATSRDPDERPADAGEFLGELRAVRAGLTPAQLDARPTGAAAVEAEAQPTTRTDAFPIAHTRALPHPTPGSPGSPDSPDSPGQPTEPDAPRRGRHLRRGVVAVVVLALVALLGVGAWWFGPGPGGMTTVPTALVGSSVNQARTSVEAAGLVWAAEQVFSEDISRGRVISTDPASGTRLRKRSTLHAKVSKGPERFTVPDVGGRTWDEAVAAIQRVNLVVGSRTESFHATVGAGRVISTDPKAGTELRRGTTVNVVLSRGREPVQLPQVVGLPLDQARQQLTDLGLVVKVNPAVNHPDIPDGAVATQEPGPSQIFRGDTVRLTPSKGPEMVTVPNVQGKQEGEARAALEAAGFRVKLEKFLGGIYGTVRSVDPRGGTKAPKGSEVTLIII